MTVRRDDGHTTTDEVLLRTDDGARLAVTVHHVPDILRLNTPRLNTLRPATVVLAHGWGAARPVWSAVVSSLVAAGHPVVTYDQRGHGASTLGRAPIGIDRLRDDLGTVLDHAGTGEVVVAGHSGGGYAALAYAVADPQRAAERLNGLVLIATAAHGQETSAGELRMMGSGPFSWALHRPALGRRLLGSMLGRRPDQAVAEANRRLFAAIPAEVRADYFRTSSGMDLRPGLAGITVPTVVLAGTADRIIAPSFGAALADRIPWNDLPGSPTPLPR
jgi:pimeloyl-ACP methyl ester carboxylesterase